MAMASTRLRCLKQLWSQLNAAAYSSGPPRFRKPHGDKTWNPALQGGRDRSRPTSGRPLPRRVQSEYDSHERTTSSSPASRHESQHSSSISTERPRTWKPELQDAPDRPSSNSNLSLPGRVQNGYSPQERFKSPVPAIGDKSQNNSSSESESDPIPFMSTDFCDHRGMQIVFLGTSSSMPTLSRNTSSIALRLAVQMERSTCSIVEKVCSDNCIVPRFGIELLTTFSSPTCTATIYLDFQEGLLCMIGLTAPPTRQPIEIYGPPGLRSWIRTTLQLAHARVANKYVVHELVLHEEKRKRGNSKKSERAKEWNVYGESHEDELPGKDILCSQDDGLWHVHEDRKYKVVAGLLKHTIPCWGYVVEEQPKTGRFDVERAKEAGVLPGPMCAKLQQGHSVLLRDGRTVDPSDVLGPPRKGRKAVILGDTSDSRSLLVAARGADVLVHEATVIEQEADFASRRGHSTASTAGRFARMIDAKSLVLTHFSGKLEGSLYGASEKGTIADLVWAAKRTFGKQSVMAAHDLAAVTVVGNLDVPLPTQ